MSNCFKVLSFSHQGQKPTQEDAYIIQMDQSTFVICDGVGGSYQGGFAAKFIVNFIKSNGNKYNNDLISLIHDASFELTKGAFAEKILTETATTIVLVKIINDTIFATHLGDSKFIFIPSNSVNSPYISKDHSLKNDLIEAGLISNDNNLKHVRNIVTKYISNHKNLNPEIEIKKFENYSIGDILLMCSDGALESYSPSDLIKFFSDKSTSLEVKWHIFSDDCKKKSKDNSTCILIEF